MREVYTFRILGSHFRQVVESARTETARTESYSVMRVRHRGEKPVVIFFSADYSRQPEYIPRRIVGVDCHVYTRLLARGHYGVEEIHEVFKQFFVRHTLVRFKQSVQLVGGVTLVPPGKAQVVFVEFFEIGFGIRKRSRPVGMLII